MSGLHIADNLGKLKTLELVVGPRDFLSANPVLFDD